MTEATRKQGLATHENCFADDSSENMLAASHHVGNARPLSLQEGVISAARYDGPGDCYRYTLHRIWDRARPAVLWIMMNPSVATEHGDDRTVAKCQRWARAWGYGSMFVGNSFAYRCTDQTRLTEVADPIGPGNDAALVEMAKRADKTILAYGSPARKILQARGKDVARLLVNASIPLNVMRLTSAGRPEHPLYLPSCLTPIAVTLDEIAR